MRNLVSLGLPVFHYGHLLPPPPFPCRLFGHELQRCVLFFSVSLKKNNVFFVEYFLIK